jgi:SLBB domain-containing protein
MMGHTISLRTAAALAVVLSAWCLPCGAQDASAPAPSQRREFESRAEIEAQAKAAEAQHRPNEAWLLRQRLQKGDFQDGDRIVVELHGNALMPKDFLGIPETLTVRAGRRLEFPRMADLPLDGVLRSELNDKLTEHFAQYVREPSVRSTPLVRLAVLGLVGRPGYVYTLADAPLSDLIMQAGGPGADANMAGIVIRRGADVIWDAQDTRAALADGMSLDRLHLRAGDEIFVPQQTHFSWLTAFSVGISAVTLLYTLTRIK